MIAPDPTPAEPIRGLTEKASLPDPREDTSLPDVAALFARLPAVPDTGDVEALVQAILHTVDPLGPGNLVRVQCVNLIRSLGPDLLAEVRQDTAEQIAQEFEAMGPTFGGDAMWLTTGERVAAKVAEVVRAIAREAGTR